MEFLRRHFAFSKTAAITVEIDPRTFTPEMAEALAANGVNRASIGVQSFDPDVQKAINRIQSKVQTAAAVQNLRRHGVGHINFDLIFGLPKQTVQSCIQTAMAAVAMRPNRFAVFGYAHIPSVIKNQRLSSRQVYRTAIFAPNRLQLSPRHWLALATGRSGSIISLRRTTNSR